MLCPAWRSLYFNSKVSCPLKCLNENAVPRDKHSSGREKPALVIFSLGDVYFSVLSHEKPGAVIFQMQSEKLREPVLTPHAELFFLKMDTNELHNLLNANWFPEGTLKGFLVQYISRQTASSSRFILRNRTRENEELLWTGLHEHNNMIKLSINCSWWCI